VNREDLIALAKKKAGEHLLYPELICGIIEQESNWNTWAMRYEPLFYQKYIAPLIQRGEPINQTEAHARATSWGLMQVMGEVARENGFGWTHLSELCDPLVGLEEGCSIFGRKLAAAEGNVRNALLLWKRHLQIDLSELRLAIRPQIFVAEAAHDLEIFLIAAHHQQLLENLG